ncbi:MAG: redoxin domain-containing protein [Phycisphaerales bacterium]
MSSNTTTRRTWLAGVAAALALTGAAWFTTTADAQMGRQPERAAEPLTIGQPAPDFTLTDMNGKEHKLSDYTEQGKIVVLEWFNPGCPFVVKFYNNELTTKPTQALAEKYKDQNVVWLLVNSTNESHPDFAKNAPMVKEWGVKHPVLMDTNGKVGKAYNARTTPHMYIINRDGTLAYQGAMDSNRTPAPAGAGDQVVNYVDQALTQIVAGETVTTTETRPYGCGVKYAN